jgi:hypothetical protein
VLVAADVDPQSRGEMLEVGDFARIAEHLVRAGWAAATRG